MFCVIDDTVIVVVDIFIISNAIVVDIIDLCSICRETIYQVNNTITVIIGICVVSNSVKIGIGIFVWVEWESIFSIGSSIAIGIDQIGIGL